MRPKRLAGISQALRLSIAKRAATIPECDPDEISISEEPADQLKKKTLLEVDVSLRLSTILYHFELVSLNKEASLRIWPLSGF